MTGDQPIGREDELAAITAFVQAAPAGPAGMVLSGSAGIGKTILWLQGVSLAGAAGVDVLTSRPDRRDGFAYAALADLLTTLRACGRPAPGSPAPGVGGRIAAR